MKDNKNTMDTRKSHNEQLIRRMKSGEPLWSYDSQASWFPPRPTIEKDPEAIKRLYKDALSQPSEFTDPTVRLVEHRLKISAFTANKKSDKIG
jgi:hypothetical protein